MAAPRMYRWTGVTAAALLGLAAFRSAPKSARPVVVTATDYAFQAPDTIAAGLTEFRLHNLGPSLHHVTLYRLEEGKTLGDLMAALHPNTPFPAWAVAVGGPNSPAPGEWSNATLVLAPGRYAMLCFIPDSANVPHFAHGMMKEFVVTGTARATLPAGDLSVKLADYSFDWSHAPSTGKQVWRVTNGAAQNHEMLVVRLVPGKTPQDVLNWVAAGLEGPPPGAPVGGLAALSPGQSNTFSLDLTPGSYALFCFVPDAKDGKDHTMHGMVRGFEVR